MRKKLPQMNNNELGAYLKKHLDNELQWLRRAATEWHIQAEMKRKIAQYPPPGYHMDVYSMDSSCLHARALFEFFTLETTGNHYGCDQYIGTVISSCRYPGDWAAPLHSNLMHAQPRSKSQKLTSFDSLSQKDLNEMPVDFAKEIVKLQRQFEKLLGSHSDPNINALQQLVADVLKVAIRNAEPIYTTKRIEQPEVKPIVW